MRKLVESTFMTLDGVISNPQDWGPPYWDDEHNAYTRRLLWDADALLLGRKTYEVFAQAWPARAGSSDYADRLNELPKHVASNTLGDTSWNASLIKGDLAEEIAKLKQQDGQNLVKYGTGELDRTVLVPNALVDEFHFWVFPVVAGSGDRLFDGLDLTTLKLLDKTTFDSGIVVLVYGPKS